MPPRDRTRRRVVPHQERAQASVDAIMEAAMLLLRDEGFARMTTNRIAERAGVNVALVYRYFSGKEAIVGALIERVAAVTERAVRDALAQHASSPFEVALRAMLVVLIDTPGVDATIHRELVEHIDVTKRREILHHVRHRTVAVFASFLADRQAELLPLADPEPLLFVLTHAIEATTHAAAFYRPDDLGSERVLDAIVTLVTRALPTRRNPST